MNPLEARRRILGRNVYKRTTEGNPAIAQGSLARRYPGITMQGWTEQAQYEGKNLFNLADLLSLIPESGSDKVGVAINVTGLKPNTYYTLSSIIEGDVGGASTNRCLYLGDTEIDSAVFVGHPVSKSSGDGGKIAVFFYPFRDFSQGIKSGRGNVQLEEGTVATTYEPYTGGQPSPSPDYPQPITNAGKHNEKTGKWEYEITIANEQTDPDKNQTVTLISDRPLTKWDKLEKRNGQWGWVYKSAEIESYTDESVPGEYFSTTGQLSTGAQVWYETTAETFVPLSESEQEQMNALYTFCPTTVLSNDCECEMTLTYKTKKSLEVTT